MEVKEGSLSVARKGNTLKVILIAFIAVLMPIYILYSKAQLSEISGMINTANAQLAEAESETLRLQAELDNIATLARVEEFAVEELGMRKISTTQGKHISLNTGNTTEVADINDNPLVLIGNRILFTLEYLGLR